jgi:hypothetical protein
VRSVFLFSGFSVIPAEAGIQVLNGSRAPRATQKLIAGGSAPAPWVTFFARAKKVTKETRPRMARLPLALLAGPRRAPQLAGRKIRAPGSNTGRATSPGTGCDARRAIRGEKEHPCQGSRWVGSPPVSRTEHRSEAGGSREPFDRARAALLAAGELGERPASRGAQGTARIARGERPGRAFFWVLFFARAKKSTSPAVREPQLSFLSRARCARTILRLNSGLRRNDNNTSGSATHKYTRPKAARQAAP